MVLQVKTKAEFDTFIKENKVVFVDFTATWCGPCKMIGPEFERLASEYPNMVFVKVDVDENADTAEEHGISAMPTFLVFKDGKKADEMVGASKEKLKALCEKHNC